MADDGWAWLPSGCTDDELSIGHEVAWVVGSVVEDGRCVSGEDNSSEEGHWKSAWEQRKSLRYGPVEQGPVQ